MLRYLNLVLYYEISITYFKTSNAVGILFLTLIG